MKTILISIMIACAACSASAVPCSQNYILEQHSLSSGVDATNPPGSSSYILQGMAVGLITGDVEVSPAFKLQPGYYPGQSTDGILPPEYVALTLAEGMIQLNWEAIQGATGYSVYSSTDPYQGYLIDESGVLDGETWSAPRTTVRRFYYVVALR
jgi:hypothetical protein